MDMQAHVLIVIIAYFFKKRTVMLLVERFVAEMCGHVAATESKEVSCSADLIDSQKPLSSHKVLSSRKTIISTSEFSLEIYEH